MFNIKAGKRFVAAVVGATVVGALSFAGAAPGQAGPVQEPVHYFQDGRYSTYILPVAEPVAWTIVRQPGATPKLRITVVNSSSAPTVVEVHSALASPDWKRVRVPAGGRAVAVLPVTQEYVLSLWERGLDVAGTVTVGGAQYKASPKRWAAASRDASGKGLRGGRLAFYRLSGYQVSGLLIPARGKIGSGAQVEVVGEIFSLTGNLPPGGTFLKIF